LHGIDHPHRGLDAENAEVLQERRVVRLERRLVEQEFDSEDIAIRQQPLAVLNDAAGGIEQLRRLAQEAPVLARPVGHRRHKGFAEHLVGHLATERLEQLEFFR
jgi:hypothetical protein